MRKSDKADIIRIIIILLAVLYYQGIQGLLDFIYMEWVFLGLFFTILITFFKTDLIKIGLRLLYSVIKGQISKRRY